MSGSAQTQEKESAVSDSKNVLVGVPDKASGGVYMSSEPLDVATYPITSLTTALPADMVPSGFISEDGVTEANETDTEKIKAWGGDTVRVVQTDHTVTYTLTFLETSPRILRAIYGEDNVTDDGTVLVARLNSTTLEHRSWAFEMKDGDKRIRIFVPDGQITSRGEVTYTHSGAISYEVTIEAFPDANGDKAIKVLDSAEADVTP